jgi:hypothetical protein
VAKENRHLFAGRTWLLLGERSDWRIEACHLWAQVRLSCLGSLSSVASKADSILSYFLRVWSLENNLTSLSKVVGGRAGLWTRGKREQREEVKDMKEIAAQDPPQSCLPLYVVALPLCSAHSPPCGKKMFHR